jgi:hypothetical protein
MVRHEHPSPHRGLHPARHRRRFFRTRPDLALRETHKLDPPIGTLDVLLEGKYQRRKCGRRATAPPEDNCEPPKNWNVRETGHMALFPLRGKSTADVGTDTCRYA